MTTAPLYNAIVDGEDLVAWAEPNTVALSDAKLDAATWTARNKPVPDELAFGVPLLKYANADVPTASLVGALVADRRPDTRRCDRCSAPAQATYELWVNCGAQTVVAVCCEGCRAHLDYSYRRDGVPSLVWR